LTPGAKAEIPVKITRLYGFSDPVNLSLILPKELGGLKAAAATIEKEKTEANLVLEAAGDVKPGQHRCTLQASLKLNNQDLKVEQPLALQIGSANPQK
jgi:hypothetical protein